MENAIPISSSSKRIFASNLANTNVAVLEALEESEQAEMLAAYKKRVAYEKELRDPDDCYLNVQQREEELHRQGEPSKIGILLNMRRVTREEILNGSFVEGNNVDEVEGEDTSDELESDGDQSSR